MVIPLTANQDLTPMLTYSRNGNDTTYAKRERGCQ